MAVYQNREAFIPCTRQALIALCLSENKLTVTEQNQFQEFCQILSAYYHFKFHSYLENIKYNYTAFNPDKSPSIPTNNDLAILKIMTENLLKDLKTILQKANYYPLSQGVLRRALADDSLFDLKTEVDFSDFEEMLCYYQGDIQDKIKLKKFWRSQEKNIDIFERVVLLIKFKEEKHFANKPTPQEQLNFKPGYIYIYLYKNLSKLDLEFIFPNVEMSMNWKDRLLFGIPAIGASISLIVKILPQLLLIIAVFFYVFLGEIPTSVIPVKEEEIKEITPLLVTTLSLLVTLGGFAFKQYSSYKSKQIKFQKNITETLFFRNMANNVGVFQYLIDAAEEEECKEIILVYYHLLTSKTLLNSEQLDDRIELWMEQKIGKKIDFNINNTLKNMESIRGKINLNSENPQAATEVKLLKQDEQNYLRVLSLEEATQLIDYIWDNAFRYV
ncbi:MAG: TMEM143 family protein [Xenococcaceae cyanobacterium MO_167.B27]|nr:TMEM143 family protein [Xenococcaceae cyanobacterium MO_167.B27]